jgi:hypothetical protein
MERSTSPRHPVIHELVVEALTIQQSLGDWEDNLRQGDKKSQLYIARLTDKFNTPADNDESGNVFPIAYDFPGFDLASALMFYEAIQIYLFGLLVEMIEYPPNTEEPLDGMAFTPPLNIQGLTAQSVECADRICQSVDYFFEADKRIIGRIVMMFPFESSRALFARMAQRGSGNPQEDRTLTRKLQFCDTVVRRFKNEGLPVWVRFKYFD